MLRMAGGQSVKARKRGAAFYAAPRFQPIDERAIGNSTGEKKSFWWVAEGGKNDLPAQDLASRSGLVELFARALNLRRLPAVSRHRIQFADENFFAANSDVRPGFVFADSAFVQQLELFGIGFD